MNKGIHKIKIYKTRESEMGYANICPGLWMYVSLQDGAQSQVGQHYASRAELLADCENYLTSWGY